ncbi:MAG: hypothetical protein ACLFWF_10270 [Alphaproteobacteria bacterium]
MTKLDVSAEIYRIRRQYPELWNFMECYWNERFDDFYTAISDAAKEYACEAPEYLTRNLLEQARRAQTDEILRAIMDDDLALAWGGMVLTNESFKALIATLEDIVQDFGPHVVPLRRA